MHWTQIILQDNKNLFFLIGKACVTEFCKLLLRGYIFKKLSDNSLFKHSWSFQGKSVLNQFSNVNIFLDLHRCCFVYLLWKIFGFSFFLICYFEKFPDCYDYFNYGRYRIILHTFRKTSIHNTFVITKSATKLVFHVFTFKLLTVAEYNGSRKNL